MENGKKDCFISHTECVCEMSVLILILSCICQKCITDVKSIWLSLLWCLDIFCLSGLLQAAFVFLPFSPQFTRSSLIPICITLLSLPFPLLAPLSPLPLSFPFFSFHPTSLTSSCHFCYPLMLSSVSLILTLHPLSLLSFSLLSCFHPSPLILSVSSHPTFCSSFHPFPRLSV